jgi:hypothetical protein
VHWTSSSIALLASATLLLLAPAVHAQTPLAPGEVARVGDTPILKTDYDHWRVIAQSSSGRGLTDEPGDDAEVRPQVMQLLVSFLWIEGEAKRLGVVVSPGAVYTTYKRQKDESFPREKDFQKFLADSGQTVRDLKRRVRLDLLSNRIRDHVVRGAKTLESEYRRLDRFVPKFTARWKAMTECGKGYESSDCGSVVPLST